MKFNSSCISTALLTTATTVTLSFLGSNAQAALLIGNIDNATFNQGNQINGSDNEFVSFTTPDDNTIRVLDDITVQFGNGGSGTNSFDATLIWYDNDLPASGDPTGVTSTINVGTQSVTVTPGEATNEVFNLTQTITLLPNTTYGFQIDGVAGSGLTWLSEFTGDFDSTYQSEVGASFVRAYRTVNSGSTWTGQTSQRIFEVNTSDVATVPEPSGVLGLLAIGFFGGLSVLKRHNFNG
ncbi:MAG: PEP-CTERM sorting domain-containing protein [Microcystaceae cyanobacterium]